MSRIILLGWECLIVKSAGTFGVAILLSSFRLLTSDSQLPFCRAVAKIATPLDS